MSGNPLPKNTPRVRLHPRPVKRRGGGAIGCLLTLAVIVCTLALIGLGLLLPPFSLGKTLFGTPFVALNQQTPGVSLENLTVALNGSSGANEATNAVSIRLRAVAANTSDPNDATWLRNVRASLPATLTLLGPLFQIEKKGTATNPLQLKVAVPQGANSVELDLYGYTEADKRWHFVPVHRATDNKSLLADIRDQKSLPDSLGLFQTKRLSPVISVVLEPGQKLSAGIAQVASIIEPAGLQPAASGNLQGVLPAGIDAGRDYSILPVIRNYSDPNKPNAVMVAALLTAKATEHADALVNFVLNKKYQGLVLDYRGLAPDMRDSYTAFISSLAQKFHAVNLTLAVVLPFPSQLNPTEFDTSAYDWQAISTTADTIQLMLPLDPHSYADQGLVDQALQWAIGQINRAKLQVAVNTLSVKEAGDPHSFAVMGYPEVIQALGQILLTPAGNIPQGQKLEAKLSNDQSLQFPTLDAAKMPSIKYTAADGKPVIAWLTTPAVIRRRLDQLKAYNLAGMVAYNLADFGVARSATDVFFAYKVNQPTNAQPEAVTLRWTVLQTDPKSSPQANNPGKILTEATALPGTPFAYKADTAGSGLMIGAELVGAQATVAPVPFAVNPVQGEPLSVFPTVTP